MARDEKTIMRGTLTTVGGLVVFYSVLAMLYAETLRSRSDFCADASFIVINGVCYTVWKMLAIPLLLGLVLLIVGLVVFRARPDELEGYLHHGTGAHFTLALLSSLVVIPFLLWIVQTVRQADGEPFVIEFSGVEFEHVFLLLLATLVGLIAFVPYLGLYISVHAKRRRFLNAVAQATEETEEEPLPHEEGFAYDDAAPAELETMPEEDWPEERDEEWRDEPAEAYPEETTQGDETGWRAVEEEEEPVWSQAEEGEEASWADAGEEEPSWADAEETEWPEHDETTGGEAEGAWARPEESQAEEKPSWMQPSDAGTREMSNGKPDEPEAPEEPETPEPADESAEPDAAMDEAVPAADEETDDGPVIGCLHKDGDGTSCPNPVRRGSRYCDAHACGAETKAGKPCANPAVEGSDTCHIHAD